MSVLVSSLSCSGFYIVILLTSLFFFFFVCVGSGDFAPLSLWSVNVPLMEVSTSLLALLLLCSVMLLLSYTGFERFSLTKIMYFNSFSFHSCPNSLFLLSAVPRALTLLRFPFFWNPFLLWVWFRARWAFSSPFLHKVFSSSHYFSGLRRWNCFFGSLPLFLSFCLFLRNSAPSRSLSWVFLWWSGLDYLAEDFHFS